MLHGVNRMDVDLEVCQPNVQTNGQVDVQNGNADAGSKPASASRSRATSRWRGADRRPLCLGRHPKRVGQPALRQR